MFIKSPPFLKSLVIRGSNVGKMRLLLVILLATLGLLLAKPSQAGTVPIFWHKWNEWMKKFVSFPNDKVVSRVNIFPWIINFTPRIWRSGKQISLWNEFTVEKRNNWCETFCVIFVHCGRLVQFIIMLTTKTLRIQMSRHAKVNDHLLCRETRVIIIDPSNERRREGLTINIDK